MDEVERVHVYTYVLKHVYMYVYIYVCVCVYVCVHVCMYVRIHVCMYVYAYLKGVAGQKWPAQGEALVRYTNVDTVRAQHPTKPNMCVHV